ncbi:hypothetical protein F9802_10170 [Bacillus aerolatus]|uniref:Flagellin C-terminal domain-containing protein n=1 Tax=Bacillus aerolatus TaxID=2653354 RepID=A0A6I1FFI3_9BACI|nr:hypothetical protein F9802_10170 [Bacillus aerolatus]
MQKEINQLTSEINRIGNTTEFNTQKLLNGGTQTTDKAVTVGTAGGPQAAVGASSISQTTASIAEQAGVYSFNISTALVAGKDLTIDGFTAITFASGGNVDTDSATTAAQQAAALTSYINAQTGSGAIGEKYTASVDSVDNTKIILTENAGFADAASATAVVGGGVGAGAVSAVSQDTAGIAEQAGAYTFTLGTALNAGESISFGGVTFDAGSGLDIDTDSATTTTQQATALKAAIEADAGLNARFTVVDGNDGTLTITEKAGEATGTAPTTSVTGATQQGVYSFDLSAQPAADSVINIDGQEFIFTDDATQTGANYVQIGADADATAANLRTAIDGNATLAGKYEAAAGSSATIELTQEVGQESATEPVVFTADKAGATGTFSANFQIGANAGQSMTIDVRDMRATSDALKVASEDGTTVVSNSGKTASYTTATDVTNGTNNTGTFKALDVSSHDKASAAIDVINDAIESVSAERSKLGAFQNRLEHTINNLGTSAENLTAAESRVRDVDMAKEMMTQTKNSILSQAAQAMLAQSNQMPQGVLQLLR